MEPQPSETPLERLQKRLYTPAPVDGIRRDTLTGSAPSAPQRWAPEPPPPAPPKISGTALFLGISIAFFVIAAVVTGVMLIMGGRSVSPDNVTISIENEQVAVSSGESSSLYIVVRNENPVPITSAVLRVEFPEGTGEAEQPGTPLSYYEEELGELPAGAVLRRTVSASFFGSENQTLRIPISVEYGTGASNATFVSTKEHEVVVSSSPILLLVQTLKEVTPGQSLTLRLSVRSNASVPLENVAVRVEGRPYPFGFTPTNTQPTQDGALFMIGTLSPGDERDITINGTLMGEEGEERVFRFSAGTLKSDVSRDFSVVYTEADATVVLAQPFFKVDLTLDRSGEDVVVADAGDTLVGLLSFANELEDPLKDGSITIALKGDAFESSSVQATNGFYQSAARTVRFDRDTVSALRELRPGETGNGSFSFKVKSGSALAALRNPSITLDVSVAARRVEGGSVAETLTSTQTKTIKIRTALGLSMSASRSAGAPAPEAEKETSYAITLNASNTVNSTAGTLMKLTLPSYVRYVGSESMGVSYNEATREVTWTIGDMTAGGSLTSGFTLAFLPSASQRGTSPTLVSAAELRGYDRFVGETVTTSASAVTSDTSVK